MGSDALNNHAAQTAAQLLVQALLAEGVDTVFCVPGESYLDVIDALYEVQDRIRLVVCRHEGSAAFMAEAYAKASGRPGVCFVTRAPGATQASIGLHTAHQDSTPLVLFIGQAASDMLEREAFQELDYRRVFAPMAKWVAQVDDAHRMPEMVSRAFHTALLGRRGPVVLALPEDVLSRPVAPPPRLARAVRAPQAVPSAVEVEELLTLMADAGLSARQLLRSKGDLYEQMGLGDESLPAEALVDAMMAHPALINRPLVVTERGTRLCRPSEVVLEILPVAWPGPFTKEDGELVSGPAAPQQPKV